MPNLLEMCIIAQNLPQQLEKHIVSECEGEKIFPGPLRFLRLGFVHQQCPIRQSLSSLY